MNRDSKSRRDTLVPAGFLLGAGLGGFLDGIILHQILQWHNMISGVRPVVDLLSAKVNMFWDGVFHAAVWLLTVWGLALLWRVAPARRPGDGWVLVGTMLGGWGLFNVLEGAVNHLGFGLHHVHEYSLDRVYWDWGFQLFGVLLVVVGLVLGAHGRRLGARHSTPSQDVPFGP